MYISLNYFTCCVSCSLLKSIEDLTSLDPPRVAKRRAWQLKVLGFEATGHQGFEQTDQGPSKCRDARWIGG